MANNLNEALAKIRRERKNKTKIIKAEERERVKTLIENEVYPIFTIGVTFNIDVKTGKPIIHTDPQQGTGVLKVVKNPNINENVCFAYVQQLYNMLKRDIVQNQKNLKRVN